MDPKDIKIMVASGDSDPGAETTVTLETPTKKPQGHEYDITKDGPTITFKEDDVDKTSITFLYQDTADNVSSNTTTPVDNDTIIAKQVSDSKWYRKPFSKVWDYIQNKISSVLGLTSSSYGGKAATAGNADTVNNHSVNKDVPSDAQFTDTTYSIFTTSSAGLAPSGGGSLNRNKILANDGTWKWAEDQTIDFTSNDVSSDADATAWTSVSKLTSGSSLGTLFNRVSSLAKNIKFLRNHWQLNGIAASGYLNVSMSDQPYRFYTLDIEMPTAPTSGVLNGKTRQQTVSWSSGFSQSVYDSSSGWNQKWAAMVATRDIGSYATLTDFLNVLKNGVGPTCGSVEIRSNQGDPDINGMPSGWYHYIMLPHRTGDSSYGDNSNYFCVEMHKFNDKYHHYFIDYSNGVFARLDRIPVQTGIPGRTYSTKVTQKYTATIPANTELILCSFQVQVNGVYLIEPRFRCHLSQNQYAWARLTDNSTVPTQYGLGAHGDTWYETGNTGNSTFTMGGGHAEYLVANQQYFWHIYTNVNNGIEVGTWNWFQCVYMGGT